MTDYDNQLAHLIKLASQPSTKEHSWHRAKELERCETGMWKGIAADLTAHMRSKSSAARQRNGG